ncbi:DUF1642 domain-containing protein [Lactiplantibacillus plantarum]|uniref:DUF1642 domain-containing protein n=1 Tax=Lactiplantibacillus plantarum TaxID=1590 RepID=UPI0006A5F140|nr:DUF1642 domain-containing protein [Lactiplantibacillus plantarum]MDN6028920.1 DUF1642 domain-containing protein [Lactobacillus sp.]ASD32954.1 hypothetical protein CEF05_10075 [Lactiplantibacillus plantarum]AXI12193.1 DUF1642 domain-containing protein [Lactiplantibacillus plantarum]KOE73466.1 hypothetical protein AB662_02280 [Lactiplantibacillus plantarum]MBW4799144.1 DUF1642 domain-containing protein [Lactiplantibacillus plantarum]
MKFYRKQPIEAEQFDGSQTSIFGYEVMPDSLLDALTGEPAYYSILIDDFDPEPDGFPDDNEVYFEIGDWIVDEADEIKVMTDDIFKKTYAELPVIPNYVAEYIDYMKSSYRDIWDAIHYPFRSNKVDKYMEDNSETFARAWLDGYQTEEDK